MTLAPTQVYGAPREVPMLDMHDAHQHVKQLARVLTGAMAGQLNCGFQVTLAPSATTTTIVDPRISLQTAVHLVPQTADAATAQAAGIWVVPAAGSAVIHHASAAAADQTFMCNIIG
jgi:hypothetical protein